MVVGSSELYKKRHQEKLKNTLLQNYYVPISIIVPAYNEEVTVVETVKSLLALEYKLNEIVVVDDGSKDSTSQKLIEAFDMKPIRRPIHRKIICQTEEFLKDLLCDRNWYVRYNAADSLERLGVKYEEMIDVFEGGDRYASEMLRYRFDRKKLKEKEAVSV